MTESESKKKWGPGPQCEEPGCAAIRCGGQLHCLDHLTTAEAKAYITFLREWFDTACQNTFRLRRRVAIYKTLAKKYRKSS
jgi:hypothetical protein